MDAVRLALGDTLVAVNASSEPDWKGLHEQLVSAVTQLIETLRTSGTV